MGSCNQYYYQPNACNVYTLVDCNKFYDGCERLFKPNLNGRPENSLGYNGCDAFENLSTGGIPLHPPVRFVM